MRGEKTVVKMDDVDFGVVVTSLTEMRNGLVRENKPTGIVDEVILKIAYAKKRKERDIHEAR
jgi:hypothetical protein